jgi:AraC-like DNA-binding protein
MNRSASINGQNKFTISFSADMEQELKKSLLFDDAGNSVGDTNTIKVATVRPGFHMLVAQTEPGYMPTYEFDLQNMPLTFSFCLSGNLEINFNQGKGKHPAKLVNKRGVNALICMEQSKGYSHYWSDDRINAVTLLLRREIVEEYLAQEMGTIPHDCRKLLRGQDSPISLPMTARMYQIAAEPFAYCYEGAVARLHLESCALELLALQVDRLVHNGVSIVKDLNRFEEERVRAVADTLIKNMAEPPSFSTLARQVGINEAKLRRGFKKVFGMSPHQFLMRQRIASARELLLGQHLDVSQAAAYVGYSNISHFIICYKRVFGVTPGCHKRECASY